MRNSGGSSTRGVGVCLQGGLLEIVYIINNFPGQTRRWLVGDEGVGGRCRDR